MTQLLQNALTGTALILAAAALRRLLKDRLVPGARLALWAACLFRLLTPAAPESALSLWGLFARPEPVSPPPPQLYNPAPAVSAPLPQSGASGFPWDLALSAVWLAVGLVLGLRYVLSWRRTRRAVAAAIPIQRPDPRYLPLPLCARLREGVMEGAPLTFGAVRPTVVLSPGLSGEELLCVLAHEGVHARRRDNLWHYAMALALVVHWWNPAVWLMARLLRQDVELSCDRAALRALGPDRRAEYANALISLATQTDGPAFCQTFGRKAAEERIRSIMKFKKLSVLGVVFTLALVAAVTAAFASDPKTDGGTIQFHGQSFSRSELSQDTLDWLDWYLALPEEEQQAVSYEPAELRPGGTPGVSDANAGEKTSGGMQTTSLPADVLAYAQALSIGMPRESVHALLGEPSFSSSSLFSDTYELDPDSFERQLGIYYEMDGTVRQVRYFSDGTDPSCTGIDLASFLADSGVIGGGDAPADIQVRTSDRLYDLCADKSCVVSYDHCHIDGKTVRVYYENPGLLCAHPDCTNEKPHTHDGVQYAGKAPEAYVVLDQELEPAPSAAPSKAFDDYTIVGTDENGYPVDEQGRQLIFDDSGELFMKVRQGNSPCIREDCGIAQEHCHKDGEVVYLYTEAGLLCERPDCRETGVHTHDGLTYKAIANVCTRADCGDTGIHTHDGVTYKGWTGKLPADVPVPSAQPLANAAPAVSCGVAGCAETRYHAHNEGRTILLSEPCPVEGCTIMGNHIHGDVCYSCNGAGHSGGQCDGTCYTYNQPDAISTSAHHSQYRHGGGHH